MCLAVPGRIVEIRDEQLQVAQVEVSGVRRNISIGLVHGDGETVAVGDWVLIHTGMALSKITEAEAQSALQLLAEISAAFQEELGGVGVAAIE